MDERIQELEEQLVGLQKQIDQPLRRRLPETRTAVTHKFDIAGHEGYLTIGLFEDGAPGEMFITMAKEGSTIGGLMDSVAALTSISPGSTACRSMLSFASLATSDLNRLDSRRTPRLDGPRRSSTMYFAGWGRSLFRASSINLGQRRWATGIEHPGSAQEQEAKRVNKPVVELPVSGSDGESIAHAATHSHDSSAISQSVAHFMEDAPTCPTCGNVTVRNGACFKCLNCGESLGCS